MLRRVVLTLLLAGCGAFHGAAGGGGSGGGSGAGGADGGALPGTYVNATFENDQGARDYRAYLPSGYRDGAAIPLVVFLHGCGESLDHAEAATRLTALAEARTFAVVYPAQSTAANPSGCWNWFLAGDQVRDRGEPSILAGLTRDLLTKWSIDPARVYVIGISAGGAMADVMGATYPDLYRAIGVVAGCEFDGLPCGMSGGPDPQTQGQSAYAAMGAQARVVPVIVFHGDADPIAAPVNGQQVTEQWIATDDWADDAAHDGSIAATPAAHDSGQADGGESWDRNRYGAGGAVVVEQWIIHGMGHAWPGGDGALAFTDARAPDASTIAYDFFLAH